MGLCASPPKFTKVNTRSEGATQQRRRSHSRPLPESADVFEWPVGVEDVAAAADAAAAVAAAAAATPTAAAEPLLTVLSLAQNVLL